MQNKKQVMKKAVALLMSMAFAFTSIAPNSSLLTVEAKEQDTAQQETVEREPKAVQLSERKIPFNDDWKFKLVNKYDINDDSVQAEAPDYDDSDWEYVEVPHDWSIYQEFENTNGVRPAQGSLPGGVGWYRKSFTLTDDFKDKTISIQFDGVQMISQVWVNGKTFDAWKQYLGYVTFSYDITDYLNFDGEENVIAVKVQTSNSSARWYSGAGIYRNVWLVATDKVHVADNGVFVTAPLEKTQNSAGEAYEKYEEITDLAKAGVDIQTEISNDTDEASTVTLKSTIYDKEADVVSVETEDVVIEPGQTETVEQTVDVENPKLWSTDDPNLYWVRTEVIQDEETIDQTDTRFGIRYIALDSDTGFYLNGVNMKLNGVCEHSDLGALGMEVYQAAIDRRIRTLKSFGCNAIRTSHNPVSPEYIEACDRLGILVFEEAYDQWLYSKNSDDYSNYFNKASDGKTVVFDKTSDNNNIQVYREDLVSNAERDIKAMVDRDKNSPAVFAWSTGNEIYDAREKHGMDTLDMLTGWIKEIDETRPVAACPPTWDNYNYNDRQQEKHLAAAEFSGFNYAQGQYEGAHQRYPEMVIFGSETASAFYDRGNYSVGGGTREPSEYPTAWNFSSATYSIEMTRPDYVAGEFVWTGHDYLGEPTPKSWPSKSSYFGIVDTAGFAKDAFYLYRSVWTDIPTVHILPQNWNYSAGQTIPLYIYTNAKSVELFLNGESLGVRNFDKETASPAYIYWSDSFEFQPGELKAVGYDGEDATGNVIATDVVQTTGEASGLELSADRAYIQNDGRDLVYVEATVVDDAGNMVPDADNKITFQVQGGEIVAVDNGNARDLDPYRGVNTRDAYNGKALVIVKATEGSTEDIKVTATAESNSGILYSNEVTVGSRVELPGDGTDAPEVLMPEVTVGKGVDVESVLPTTIDMLYSNGVIEQAVITAWNLENLKIDEPGEYTVTGTADGLSEPFKCKIFVKEIKSVTDVDVTTIVGVEPSLPRTVTVEYADDTVGAAVVEWDEVPEESYAQTGNFEVRGSIGGGHSVTARVAVKEVRSIEEVSEDTLLGQMPTLPSTVEVTFTDDTTEEVGVSWAITQEDVESAGVAKITGKLLGSLETTAKVNVQYVVYATDLEWTDETSGTVVADRTVGGSELSARVDQGGPPTPYDRGIGTLADSEVVYDISGKGYDRFQSYISLGFDYGQGAQGAVVFKVYLDGEEDPAYESPVMTHATKNILVDVDVSGASKVRLVTEVGIPEGGEAFDEQFNLGDWCDAKFVSSNLTVQEAMPDENFFYYAELGEIPKLYDTVDVKIDEENTASFHVEWPELTSDMFDTASYQEIEGTVTGAKDTKVKAKVIVDYQNAILDADVLDAIGGYSISEIFNYVDTPDAKVDIDTMEDIHEKSTLIYDWTSNLLIENCTTKEYGFNYGVYPDPNSANPEYLIVRAPDMKGFTVRGTANNDGYANNNFTFYTSADGKDWTEFTDYEKTVDDSREGWPSRFYTADELPADTHFLKIAFPTGNTWQFNLNEVYVHGGRINTVNLDTNGGTLPSGTADRIFVPAGQAVGELPTPERNRYAFKGWFTQKEGGEEITASYVPEASTVIYAQWEKIPVEEEETVIYFVDSGATSFSEEGQAFVDDWADTIQNTSPDQAYSASSGWGYTNSASDLEVNGSGDAYTTIRHFQSGHNGLTMTYKFALDAGTYNVVTGFYDPWAEWTGDNRHAKITVEDAANTVLATEEDYKISGNKETVTLEDVVVGVDGDITVNLTPLRSNPDALDSCDMLISFIVIIKKPGDLTRHTVTYDAQNGTEPTEIQVIDGGKLIKPEDPTREGYVFEGWYQDETLETIWNFDTDTVTEDLTLYAKWSEEPEPAEKVTVTYEAGEGGRIEGSAVQTIDKGGSTTQVTAVAEEGYEFVEWSDGNTQAARTDSNVQEDVTYTASFQKTEGPAPAEKVTVTYVAGEGGKIAGTTVQTINKGGSTTQVTAVANEGYTFSRWSDGVTTAQRTDANVTASKIVTAQFTKNQTVTEPEPETPDAERVKLNVKKKITIGVKEKVQLKANVLPAGASQKVTWKSSKKSVVSVNANGKITGKKRGTAIITATAENGKKVTCRVTVKKAPKKITVKSGINNKTLKKGKSWTMKVKFPAKSASYKVTFKSNRKKVATVNANGKIKARKKGTAIITARTYNGKTVKVKIRVR